MEFKDELDALGVKVDKVDKRLAVMEDRLGGWKLSGSFTFDANFTGNDNNPGVWYGRNGERTDFSKELFSLYLTKYIDENTLFSTRFRAGNYVRGDGRGDLDGSNLEIDNMFVQLKLKNGGDVTIGRFKYDAPFQHSMYWTYDAAPIFGNYRLDGFKFDKPWGNFRFTGMVGRNASSDYARYKDYDEGKYMHYIFDLSYTAERAFLGFTGYILNGDAGQSRGRFDSVVYRDYNDMSVYNIYGGVAILDGLTLKGSYYWQNFDGDFGDDYNSNPNAWHVILDVDQKLLKYTSLWLEYVNMDNTFVSNQLHTMDWAYNHNSVVEYAYLYPQDSSTILMAAAEQKWNDKFTSYIKYAEADYGAEFTDKVRNWTVGVLYQYTPAIQFGLTYDNIDYGNVFKFNDELESTNHIIKFRTTVNF